MPSDDQKPVGKPADFEKAKRTHDALFENPSRFFDSGFGHQITYAELYGNFGENDIPEVKGIVPIPLDDPHFAAIGKIVINWAALELMVDSAIWQIAKIPDDLGASLTSQIGNFDGKIKALGSLLVVRDDSADVISKMNKFSEEARGLLTLRNRIVHDGWIGDAKTGTPHRMALPSAKSKGVPTITYLPYSTEKLNEAVEGIALLIDKFQEIIKPAIDKYPPLPRNSSI